ncbi:MAG: hypothetical protein RLO80_01140 [Hyphomonas sp.]
MNLKLLRSGFGKLVTALVSLAFLLTPMASALHVEAAPEAVCAAEHDVESARAEAAGHEDHEHHAHGCGTCHVHLIRPAGWLVPAIDLTRSGLRPLTGTDIGGALPSELFRPPRG